jgi:hypothetical protein
VYIERPYALRQGTALAVRKSYEKINGNLKNPFCPANRPGVDVMITIFCDFCQFSAKKLALVSKTNVMIKILHNLALF